jgi:hypothetical protein
MIPRRAALWALRAGAAAITVGRGRLALAATKRPQRRQEPSRTMPKQFPPFELQAAPEALLALQRGLTGFAVEKIGTSVGTVWLRNAAGQDWAIGDDTRSLQFKFEVFALAIQSLDRLRAR